MATEKTTIKIGTGDSLREVTIEHDALDPAPWGADAKLTWVGRDVPRVDGFAKASGAAKYSYDAYRPNMAFARVLRSPHAHARVKSVDVEDAKKLPGVLQVEILAGEHRELTYAGAPIAAVCADTEARLDDALAAIRVEYEVLPCVVDATDGLADASPRVDAKRPNASEPRGRPRGDADKAMASAPVKVSGEYRTSVQTHVALEPHGSVAEFDAEGNLTIWCSTQATGSVQNDMAQMLGIPGSKVRVLTEFMGGGFGCKFGPDLCDRTAVKMAKAVGRPVQCMNDRREEHLTGGNRPDSVQRLTLGATKEGDFLAITGEAYGTPGNGSGGSDAANTALYDIPNQKVTQRAVSTHTAIGRAFRAPGHPQGVFALESLVDELAFALGMDPLELRRRNDKHPLRTLEWPVGAQRIDWAKQRRKVPGSDKGPVKRGIGCAGGVWGNFGGGSWRIDLSVGRDGSVVVQSAVQDIGTGTKTVLAILVAEELGIAPSAVTVRIGDTRFPPGPGSGGSVTAVSVGPAAREAGLRAKEGVAAVAAKAWGCKPEEVSFEAGQVKGPGGKSAPFATACAGLPPEGLSVSGQRRGHYKEEFSGTNGGVQFAQVAVDVETGVVKVEKVVAVHDCGRVVDALTARNQVNGGVIQGISYALFEERRLDKAQGDMVNPTYDSYRICGMADCPEIDVVFLDGSNGKNNVGLMGLGEPATVPTAAAVANAVFNATGARVREIPMTPPRVLAALAAAKGGAK